MIKKIWVATLALACSSSFAFAQTEVQFALDWKFEGPSAPYFAAIDNGHFEAKGLSVEISAGQGSLDAIPKVATAAFPIGFADINSLIKFLDQNPGAPVTAVMMVYDQPPFAVVGLKSLGVEVPADLHGKVLGAPPPDGAWAQFPAFATANNLDMTQITVEPVGFPTREPALAEGTVDAITGFSFSSFLSLVRIGVPESDISVILMAEHGLELYGNAIIVNTDYAAENPDVVKGFLEAVVAGWKDAIADPAGSVEFLVKRNPAADAELEVQRLQIATEANVLTDYVMENGFGDIDPDRFSRALEQLKENFEFDSPLEPKLYFTSEYLPAAADRMLQ